MRFIVDASSPSENETTEARPARANRSIDGWASVVGVQKLIDRRTTARLFRRHFCIAIDDRDRTAGLFNLFLRRLREVVGPDCHGLFQLAFAQDAISTRLLGVLALIVAIVTEMFMGGYGLGGAMNTASRFADSRGVFAGIVEIAVVGYALVKTMALIRRRLLIWHQEANEPTTA